MLREQDAEFFAAVTTDEPFKPGGRKQDSRDTLEHAVAGAVAEAVVDALELVHVDHDASDAARLAAGDPRPHGVELFEERPAVQTSRHRVGRRELAELYVLAFDLVARFLEREVHLLDFGDIIKR